MSRFFRSALFPLIVIVLLVYLASQTLLPGRSNESEEITYSQLKGQVDENPSAFESVLFDPNKQSIEATMQDGTKLKVNYPTDQSQIQFEDELAENGILYDSKGTGGSAWWNILGYLLPFVLFFHPPFLLFLLLPPPKAAAEQREAPRASPRHPKRRRETRL